MKLSSIFNFLPFFCKDLPKSTPSTYDYYHQHTFWNDHMLIREYMNEQASGDKNIDWVHYLYEHYFNKKHNLKLLSLVSGNGWQDRMLDNLFNLSQVDGYDVSPELLSVATKTSNNKKYHYNIQDLNHPNFKKNFYDLAVNVAGLHHIQDMDTLLKNVSQALKPNGVFVNYDYIGPIRNQYSDTDLKYMNLMQKTFPHSLVGRQPIIRPDLSVMMSEDPSEAVGSELIIPTLKNYFHIDYLRYLNGGMLYQVLYNQVQNFDQKNSQQNKLLLKNINLEKKLTRQGLVKPLFAYIICIKT